MEQQTLISEAKNLINQAQDSEGFARPAEARIHLEKLRGLLNTQLELKAEGSGDSPDTPETPEEPTTTPDGSPS